MSLRSLHMKPKLLAEWGEEYEERSAEWWELFLDLLLVAACANMTDGFKEHLNAKGLLAFLLHFSFFYTGWSMYTFHQTRFYGDSLFHNSLLFLYMLGNAGMVVNASAFEFQRGFSGGVIIQRLALALMYMDVGIHIPRSRKLVARDVAAILTSVVFLSAAIIIDNYYFYIFAWLVGTIQELFGYPLMLLKMDPDDLIPLNIDHCQERFGCLLMVIIGEGIISGVINYTKIQLHDRVVAYYGIMTLCLMMTFAIGLIYYAVIPPRTLHAFRRHRFTGILFIWFHWGFFAALLLMETGMKFVVHVTTSSVNPSLTPGQTSLIFTAAALAVIGFVGIRVLHYWGRQPSPLDSPPVRKIKWIWWGIALAWFLLPAALGMLFGTGVFARRPFPIAISVGSCFMGYAVLESVLTSYLASAGVGNIDYGGIEIRKSGHSVNSTNSVNFSDGYQAIKETNKDASE